MKRRQNIGGSRLGARTAPKQRQRARRSEESGFAFLMALGMLLIVLALSLTVLQNYVTDGKRAREEDTIWRGEQYKRAVRLYYHKMGHYPQTIDDLKKGGVNLHFLRQVYKNPMNKTDGTWRFIYVNASGQIIGSVRYANLQQMVLVDQYAGLIPGAPMTGTQPAQLGVSAASLASSSGSGSNSQQLQTLMAGILNGGDSSADAGANLPSQQPPPGTTASDAQSSGTAQSGAAGQSNGLPAGVTADQVSQAAQNGQLPPGVTPDQIVQYAQSGQLPPGITPDMAAQYIQNGGALPPGVTADQALQYLQGLQGAQNPGNTQPPQSPGQPGQTGFGPSPGQPGQAGQLGFGQSPAPGGTAGSPLSSGSAGQSSLGINPLLQLKPSGPVDGPVLGGFLTGVACTTDIKSLKVYRRGKKYIQWEFIWNPLEDALAAQQGQGGGAQGVLPGQTSGTPSPLGGSNNNPSNPFGSSPTSPSSLGGPQQPLIQQQPQ
jgi:hypothetical protein